MGDDAVIDLGKAGSFEPYKKEATMPSWKRFVNVPNTLFFVSVVLVLIYFFTLSPNPSTSVDNNATINSNVVKSETPVINKTKLLEINYFYESLNCTSCLEGKAFLESLKNNNKLIKLNLYEMSYHPDNKVLLKTYSKEYSLSSPVVIPETFINEKYFSGFTNGIGSDIQLYVDELTKE